MGWGGRSPRASRGNAKSKVERLKNSHRKVMSCRSRKEHGEHAVPTSIPKFYDNATDDFL
jgi:hypothetical protein